LKSQQPKFAAPLQRVLKERLQRLQELVAVPQTVIRRTESVHRLRVDLKEWHAALHLLRGVDPDFPCTEYGERFKPVFHLAGRVRFWQLQRSFLNRAQALPGTFAAHYRAHISQRLREARKDFATAARDHDWPAWEELKPVVQHAGKVCTMPVLQGYFAVLLQNMVAKQARLNRRRTHELHELRKSLREFTANRKLAARHLGFDPGPAIVLAPDIPALQDLLGDWHDQDAAWKQLAEDLGNPAWEEAVREQGKQVLLTWRKTERKSWREVMSRLASAPG
jgi:CHAD domain-containing protein